MKICGLQKLSLLDYPELLAATVFTGGCNFRCPFCHNASLVLGNEISEDITESEFFDFLEKRKGRLDGVCISGGEPLLQPDIEDFICKIRSKGFKVKLDTNGSFPERLKRLLDEKILDYVAMDIKNSPEKYPETVGQKDFDILPVKKSVELLMNGSVLYEFRTTVARELHDENDIEKIGRWINGARNWYLQCFVDSGDVIGSGLSAYTPDEMRKLLSRAEGYAVNTGLRGV